MKESVVVTGIGMVTPLGMGRKHSWKRVKEGFPVNRLPLDPEGRAEFRNFYRQVPLITEKEQIRAFDFAEFAMQEALDHSGLNLKDLDPERIASSVSISKPILPNGSTARPVWPDAFSSHLARKFQIGGMVQNYIAACSTGLHSIISAARWLGEEKCDVAFAGSSESSIHPLYLAGFKQMGVLSETPAPFDKRRNGFLMGEGAGLLILERKKDALARKAAILAEICSFAVGSDCSDTVSFDSSGSSIEKVLRRALAVGGLEERVGYVNLHGTGTELNDLVETRAIKSVFGKRAKDLSLSSTKSSTGHLLGAAGGVEAGLAVLALRDQFVPPTANLEVPDPECDLDYTPRFGRIRTMEVAVSLSFGFGGAIGAICFGKC